MSGLKLRVVWPIVDDAMYDDEALAEAWFEWPAFPERYQVTVVDSPRMQVIRLDAEQRQQMRASRAVVCEAPVIQRAQSTPSERRAA